MENSIEKEISGSELTSEDGLLIWRELYSNGSVGVWERTGISTADRKGLLKLKSELEGKYGSVNE